MGPTAAAPGSTGAAADTTSQETTHVLAHLHALSGSAVDTAFVNHEIDDHKHDIGEAYDMASAAQNPA